LIFIGGVVAGCAGADVRERAANDALTCEATARIVPLPRCALNPARIANAPVAAIAKQRPASANFTEVAIRPLLAPIGSRALRAEMTTVSLPFCFSLFNAGLRRDESIVDSRSLPERINCRS
jgi:hypothetical protein